MAEDAKVAPQEGRPADAAQGDPRSEVAAGVRLSLVFETTEANRVEAIRRSAERLMAKVRGPQAADAVWTIQEAVWPALGLSQYRDWQARAVRLTLLPLSRIGQMEGKSGSFVLLGYFSFEEAGTLCSHPLVVKTMDRSKSAKLVDEYRNALGIKPFAYESKDHFAIPIHFDEDENGYGVLWSVCSATGSVPRVSPAPGEAFAPFDVHDLRKPLKDADDEKAGHAIEATFDLLSSCHRRFVAAVATEVEVGQEYEWYLRGLGTTWADGRSDGWVERWGTGGDQFTPGSGEKVVNPLWVVERLRSVRFPLHLGAIHGDLHPGNIILKEGKAPAIIDFGWAQDSAHIAKDFVLLECNLRFLTLRAETRDEEIGAFCKWVAWDAAPPAALSGYLVGRVKLIQRLRGKAAAIIPAGVNWDQEYVVPLFLVAVGLMRFAPQLGNQRAAIQLVQSLASYLAETFKL